MGFPLHLIETMGGPVTAGVGWAAGIERLALLLAEAPARPRPFVVIPVGAAAEGAALKLTQTLRHEGFAMELGYSGNLKKRMKRANGLKAYAAILLGDEELAQGAATVRNLDSGEQELVPLDALSARLAAFL